MLLLKPGDKERAIVISPVVTGSINKITFDLTGQAVLSIANAGLAFRLETPLFSLNLDLNALMDIVRGGTNIISISIVE